MTDETTTRGFGDPVPFIEHHAKLSALTDELQQLRAERESDVVVQLGEERDRVTAERDAALARIAALEAERDAETTRADAYERSHIEIRKALGMELGEHAEHEAVITALEARDRLIAELMAALDRLWPHVNDAGMSGETEFERAWMALRPLRARAAAMQRGKNETLGTQANHEPTFPENSTGAGMPSVSPPEGTDK